MTCVVCALQFRVNSYSDLRAKTVLVDTVAAAILWFEEPKCMCLYCDRGWRSASIRMRQIRNGFKFSIGELAGMLSAAITTASKGFRAFYV